MTPIDQTPAWKALVAQHAAHASTRMDDMFAADPDRFARFSLRLGDLTLDYSKNLIDAETMRLLHGLAREADLSGWIEKLFGGDEVNPSEKRPALHTLLRGDEKSLTVGGFDAAAEARAVRERLRAFAGDVREGRRVGASGERFTDVVHIGIGGSELGPRLVVDALRPDDSPLRVHFISGLDDTQVGQALKGLKPATTLVLIVSKSWTTAETQANAGLVRLWLRSSLRSDQDLAKHVVAVTAKPDLAHRFGVGDDAVFPMWDWVGGRYSLWSAVGLPIALACGVDRHEELLAGAHAMDEHFRRSPLEENLPVTLALLGVWYMNFFGAETQVMLPYDWRLKYLPAWLQQLDMESNGKSVDRAGAQITYETAPVIWGGPGNEGQHAFFQLLHQGKRLVPADFIGAAEGGPNRDALIANMLAQTEALMRGSGPAPAGAPHRFSPGNRPSNTILMRRLDARTLGALLALYEHKVFVQGVIWRLNSFDQWGVELGKTLAARIEPELKGGKAGEHDGSTSGLIAQYRAWRKS